MELSNLLALSNESQNARKAAAIQLKNYLTSKDDNVKAQYQQRWLAFDTNNKTLIRNNVCHLKASKIFCSRYQLLEYPFIIVRSCIHFRRGFENTVLLVRK